MQHLFKNSSLTKSSTCDKTDPLVPMLARAQIEVNFVEVGFDYFSLV